MIRGVSKNESKCVMCLWDINWFFVVLGRERKCEIIECWVFYFFLFFQLFWNTLYVTHKVAKSACDLLQLRAEKLRERLFACSKIVTKCYYFWRWVKALHVFNWCSGEEEDKHGEEVLDMNQHVTVITENRPRQLQIQSLIHLSDIWSVINVTQVQMFNSRQNTDSLSIGND